MIIASVMTGNQVIMVLAIAVWNLIAASGMFIAARGIFANIEVQ
jgi:hypothetical protein